MIVLLRNITSDTLRSDIVKFLSPVVKGGFLRRKGEIKSVKMLTVKDNITKLVESHALVQIEPDTIALRVIKKLHNTPFKGKRVIIRQYHAREKSSGHNVPHYDKRRELEITELSSPHVIGDRRFHRLYNS